MMEKIDSKRIEYLDIVKGIAIFLVVWGHSIQVGGMQGDIFEDRLFTFIYSFHMPLFMIISGYFFSKTIHRKTFWEHVKSKITRLVCPAVIWGVLFYIVKVIVENLLLKKVFIFKASLLVQEIWNVWFLWTVFFCSIAVLVVSQVRKKSLFVMGLFLAMIIMYYLPNGNQNVFMLPYFFVGYLWQKKGEISVTFRSICFMVFPLLLMYYTREHFIYVSGIADKYGDFGVIKQIGVDLYRWGIGFIGSISVITLVELMAKDTTKGHKVRKAFSQIGKFTLEIYVFQRILVEYMGAKVMWKIVNESGLSMLTNEFVYDYIFTLFFAIIYIIVLYYMAVVYRTCINKVKQRLIKI